MVFTELYEKLSTAAKENFEYKKEKYGFTGSHSGTIETDKGKITLSRDIKAGQFNANHFAENYYLNGKRISSEKLIKLFS